jgi:hypothetical protein
MKTLTYFELVQKIYNVKKSSIHFNKIDPHTFGLQVTAVHPQIKTTTAVRCLRTLRAADRHIPVKS